MQYAGKEIVSSRNSCQPSVLTGVVCAAHWMFRTVAKGVLDLVSLQIEGVKVSRVFPVDF